MLIGMMAVGAVPMFAFGIGFRWHRLKRLSQAKEYERVLSVASEPQ